MRTRFVLTIASFLVARFAAAAPVFTTSAAARVLHDTNLYLQNPAPLAAGQTRPGVPADENANAVDVSASVVATWKALTNATMEVGYAPDAIRYANHASENHTDHVVTANAVASADGWTGDIKARVALVDGSSDAPIYNRIGATPAIGGEPVRARRAQTIARASGKISRELGSGFVRVVVSAFDQNFHTVERATTGYCNYADRGESSAGAEAGWRIWGNLALVGGTRFGFQRQANVLGVPLNYSNTFTRGVAGLEGAATRTLKLSALVGPDGRHYGESVRSGFKRRQQTAYGEMSATWAPTKSDTIMLSGKRYLWLSSAGRGAYADAIADLSWRRKLAAAWSATLSTNYHEGDTSHFNVWSPRHDRVYTETIGVSRVFAAKARLELEAMHDWGVSLLPNTPGREYRRWIFAASIARSW